MRTLGALVFLAACRIALGQTASVQVAAVDGEPVFAAEVERELAKAYPDRKLAGDERRTLLAQARDQVIDRRLVLRRLVRQDESASTADVDHALARLEKQITDQGVPLAEHYQRLGITRDEVRQTLLWQLSWQTYLKRYLTDENLARYFERNRRDFDGTQLRVAHLLIKPADSSDAALAAAIKQAGELRESIASGKLAFADAAKQHSQGPSAKGGGDIGWIERREPMPEAFSAAAFALNVDEVSPPVTTTFGVHLIQVLEVKPGTKTWQDAAERLRPAATLFLFRRLANLERAEVKVERVENWP
ncbi:MAG: peptidylprolyl isomerase [Planctomycetaceae bacterium]|nr:peptidylprolyl isomerase [Planctomycetaceae bacterium]